MIRLENVSKVYAANGQRRQVFRGLDLALPEGNVAIMGPNGAGKSTLLRLIAGTELPDRGRVVRDERVSWPLGFAGGFNGSMTGIENARFVARIYGADTAAVLAFVDDFAELGPALRRPVRTYSSGMKARLAFGLSMAIRFDTYLIDEITAVGDEAFRRKCDAVFRERLSTSRIVMVSHSVATIRALCDCGVLVAPDRLAVFTDTASLTEAYSACFAPG